MPQSKKRETNNRFLKAIEEYLKNNEMTMEEIALYFSTNEKTFRSEDKNFPSPRNKNPQSPFTLEFVRQMVLACNIPPDTFLLNDEEWKKWEEWDKTQKPKTGKRRHFFTKEHLENGVFTKLSPQSSTKSLLKLDAGNKNFQDTYFDAIKPYIECSEKRILISECLSKGNNNNPGKNLKEYEKANEKIFKLIEQRIKARAELDEKNNIDKPSFFYKRVLVLPLSYNHEEIVIESQLREAIIECSLPVFEHLYRCLSDYDKFCRFYVAQFNRSCHYGIIDDKYILSEYYKYEKSFLNPDLLFIDEVLPNSKLTTIFHEYQDEMEGIKDENRRLTKENLVNITHEAMTYLELEINDMKSCINLMQNNPAFTAIGKRTKNMLNNHVNQIEPLQKKLDYLEHMRQQGL